MSRILSVEVTQEDIDLGERDSSTSCAVARAVNRLVDGEGLDVDVDPGSLSITGYEMVSLPPTVEEFIANFDDFVDVSPIQFTVELLEIDEGYDDWYD